MRSTIAIVEPRYVARVGLETILQSLFPVVDIVAYNSFEQFQQIVSLPSRERPYFVHFFVNQDILQYHADFFASMPQITISLCYHNLLPPAQSRFYQLDMNTDEHELCKQIVEMRAANNAHIDTTSLLSKREIDVLRLVAKGMINKEIADQLNIGLNTVITHRAHITEKLEIKSVPALTMYAVVNGYIDYSEIYSSTKDQGLSTKDTSSKCV